MKSCAFFGHGNLDYREYEEEIKNSIVDLIENYDVAQFYTGGRGTFDSFCSRMVYKVKNYYPHIHNTLVLSYMPAKDWELPAQYDDSVYLLETNVPPKYAIVRTNQLLIDKADFVLTAVCRSWGGARTAHDYATRKKKLWKNIFDDKR